MGKFRIFSQVFNQLRIRPNAYRKAEWRTELTGFRTYRAVQVDKIKDKGYTAGTGQFGIFIFFKSSGSCISGLRESIVGMAVSL